MSKSYSPNFHDPRVVARSRRALAFACGVMRDNQSRSWSSRFIDKYFGMSSRPLSRYLRDQLLICTNDHYRFHSDKNYCKEYRLNTLGADRLRQTLNITNHQLYHSVTEVAQQHHQAELTTGNFAYDDKSHRLWHPLQRYRKSHRTQILADHGYLHDYDIQCCAPTLIHQHAQRIPEIIVAGQWRQGPMDVYLFALGRYLQDRAGVRTELAQQLELPVAAVKEIINALFAGAVISRHPDSDIWAILMGDLARIEYLKQNEFVQELRQDIRTCWEYIRPVMQRRVRKTARGTWRLLPLTARQKWNVYFELERVVMNSVRSYLDDRSIRYFLTHDGWTCDTPLEQHDVIAHIKNVTGFNIQLDYTESPPTTNTP